MMTAMKISHEITYDATPDEVFAMLSTPEFRQKSCDAMGVLDRTIAIDVTGDGMRVHIDQVQPTAGVPSFAKKFVGETTQAIQEEVWNDHTRGELTVRTPGKPTEIKGVLTLTDEGGRTVERFEGEARFKVPLVGGKLEGLLADLFKAGMDREHTAGVAWLAGER